jgi:hypothetical protein
MITDKFKEYVVRIPESLVLHPRIYSGALRRGIWEESMEGRLRERNRILECMWREEPGFVDHLTRYMYKLGILVPKVRYSST